MGIPTFVFNHKISGPVWLTGNFFNTVDRDGLHGGPSDTESLYACDKTRLESSGSMPPSYYTLIIPMVIGIIFMVILFWPDWIHQF